MHERDDFMDIKVNNLEFNDIYFGDICECINLVRKGLGKFAECKKVERNIPLVQVSEHEYITMENYMHKNYTILTDRPQFESEKFIDPASLKVMTKKQKNHN